MKIENSRVLYRQLSGDMPTITRGRGCWLYDNAGRKYIDMSSGPCCSSLGHSNREVLWAIASQAVKIPNVFSGFWASEAAEQAGSTLYRQFEKAKPSWFGRVIFQNGGGEAVDLACKLASQYHAEVGADRTRFASLEHSFHGVGLLPFSLSGDYPRYEMMGLYHDDVDKNYVVQLPNPMTSNDAYCLNQVRNLLVHKHYCKIAALIIEPVGGPQVGIYPHSREYLQGLRNLCDELDILLIFDEILCGSGRCGYLSMTEYYDVWPDMVLLGKGLTSGYQPMSAICISEKVIDRIRRGSGMTMFGTTYSAHTTGCAAVAATLEYLDQKYLYEHVSANSVRLRGGLESLLDFPMVDQISGAGYLFGIHLKPFPPEAAFHVRARKAIFDSGAVVYSKGQTVNGQGDFLIVAPPFEISPTDLQYGIECIAKGLEQAYKEYQDANVCPTSD
jgi:adenosylmethionine-8-amino-7-oxononanoate aminotransferase